MSGLLFWHSNRLQLPRSSLHNENANKNKQVSSTHTHTHTNKNMTPIRRFSVVPTLCSNWQHVAQGQLPNDPNKFSPHVTSHPERQQPMRVSKVETNEKKVRARNKEKHLGSIIVQRHTILLIWRHNLLANKTAVDVSCSLATLLRYHPLVYSTARPILIESRSYSHRLFWMHNLSSKLTTSCG